MRVFIGTVILAAAAILAGGRSPVAAQGWPQWGGPTRDFKAAARGLAATWPASGPRVVWSRDLGEGYSAIVADQGLLFTMYRPVKGFVGTVVDRVMGAKPEVVVALDEASGRTVWEYSYDAPFLKGMGMEYGPGPHATPTVKDGLVYAVGVTGKLHALDAKSGRLVWSHDLYQDYGGKVQGRGYSCSPVVYGDTVIVTVGGRSPGLMAFRARDGAVAWKNGSFDPAPSTPLLVDVDGQPQLVVFHADGVSGFDPASGARYWDHPHETEWGLNISTPVFGEGNLLFVSSGYSGGSRVLQLARSASGTTVKELWHSNRMRLHIGNAMRLGDRVYGSSGDFGPAPFTAVDVRTGEVAWQDRGVARATSVYADGKLFLLDEDGTLALATVAPDGLKVHSRASVLTNKAWTVPTLVGTTLYVRDRASVKALDLRAP
jgi:outer membrane protein assembly factor BamB